MKRLYGNSSAVRPNRTSWAALPLLVPALMLALALRLTSLGAYVQHHDPRALASLPFLFEPGNIAASLAAGHGFSSPLRVESGPTAWMTPVYPLILAVLNHIFGTYTIAAFLAAALINSLLSALTCVPVFFAGRRLGGSFTGAVAAVLWAIFPPAIVLPYESLWDGSLSAFLAALILWATLELPHLARKRAAVGYGMLWGFALMTNAVFAGLAPFLFGWLARAAQRRNAALALSVALLCCVPWTLRNAAVFHAFVPLRSAPGLAFWVGNNERADGLVAGNVHPISNTTERERYIQLGEMAYMREKGQQAFEFMISHPRREMELVATRFVATWSGGSVHPLSDFLQGSRWFRWVLLFHLVCAAGALAGSLVLYRAHSPYWFPATVFPLFFPIVYYFSLSLPRYRHPMDPAVMILTAVAARSICQTGIKQKP